MFRVSQLSQKNKIVLSFLRKFFSIYKFLLPKYIETKLEAFEEDPKNYSLFGVLFLGYKYYLWDINNSKLKISRHSLKNSIVSALQCNHITLSFGGDLIPYETFTASSCENLWYYIGENYFSSDIVVANLESPIDISKEIQTSPKLMLNNIYFNLNEEIFEIFNGSGKFKGHTIFSLANNHSLDQGVEGVHKTIEYLENKNIGYVGVRKSINESYSYIKEINGCTIGFISCTYSLNEFEDYQCKKICHVPLHQDGVCISQLHEQAERLYDSGCTYLILLSHYGNAYQLEPTLQIKNLTRKLFEECGFDLIIGNHAHCVQTIETISYNCPFTKRNKSGIVAYALGDLVSDDINYLTKLSMYLKIKLFFNEKNEVQGTEIDVNPIYKWDNDGKYTLLPLDKITSMPEFKIFTDEALKEYLLLKGIWKNFVYSKHMDY